MVGLLWRERRKAAEEEKRKAGVSRKCGVINKNMELFEK